MNSRKLLFWVFVLALTGSVLIPDAMSQTLKETPNILFIAVDDLRPEINCYGAHHMQTPNIDRLAREGLLFERAYCQQAICMASRASIMSGIRPEYKKLYNCSSLLDLAPDVLTLNEHFANQGYSTYSIGKIYHHGEDRSDQFPDSWDDPTERWTGRGYVSPEAIAEMMANTHFDQAKKEKGPAYEMADVPDKQYIDGYNAELAVQKLKDYKKSDQPFFLALGFHKPHLPWCAPKKYWDMYPAEGIELSAASEFPEGMTPYTLTNWGELRGYFGIPQGKDQIPDELALQLRRAYYATVSYMDAQLGKVLDALDQYGHKENTVVILWGDHGWKLGDHHAWSKHTNFESDTRVPMIISVPGMGTAGRRTLSFAEFVDVYPTLCDLAGIPKPSHLQGESLVPVLDDPEQEIKEYACSIFPRNREDDLETVTGFSIRTDQYRYVEWIHLVSGKTMGRELYDHKADPLENRNVADQAEYIEPVSRLSALLHEQYDAAIPGVHMWTGTTLYDPASLLFARSQYMEGIAPYTVAVDSLKATADRLMDNEPWSVMQKKMMPPSGNKHDYYSLGIYWWPNPDTENGLPYIRKDGIRNPEYGDYDGPAIHQVADATFTLSLAWYYSQDERYARKAVEFLDTWFLDPATRMNPHLEFGQAIPGITEGRGIGIIETGTLVPVVSGIELLESSSALSKDAYNGLKAWFTTYTQWLVGSQKGWDERMWHNNHGSSYDSQVATFALFSGEDSIAAMILDSVKVKRIARQIEPDGSQPWELERTKAMSYSIKNLRHLIENAILAEGIGTDLWNYEPEPGRSILQAIKYLVPFFTEGKAFPYQQIGGIDHYADDLAELIWVANQYYGDSFLEQALIEIPAIVPEQSLLHLTYPDIHSNLKVAPK